MEIIKDKKNNKFIISTEEDYDGFYIVSKKDLAETESILDSNKKTQIPFGKIEKVNGKDKKSSEISNLANEDFYLVGYKVSELEIISNAELIDGKN